MFVLFIVKTVSGNRLQMIFTDLDAREPSQVCYFCVKIKSDKSYEGNATITIIIMPYLYSAASNQVVLSYCSFLVSDLSSPGRGVSSGYYRVYNLHTYITALC